MITVLIINTIAVLFAFFAKFKQLRWALTVSFIILFVFMAIRYNYGNDYKAYKEMFEVFSFYSSQYSYDGERVEPGWILFNIACKPLGFSGLVALWSLAYVIVYYLFIKKYVNPRWYWLAVFIMVFDPYNMLIPLSMFRQALACLIFILSVKYIVEKKILLFFILIYIASLFHTSAFLLLPLGFIGFFNFEITPNKTIIMIIIVGLVTIFAKTIFDMAISSIFGFFPAYQYYIDNMLDPAGVSLDLIIMFAIMSIILIYQKGVKSDNQKLLVKLVYIYYLFLPVVVTVFPMLSRILFYFTPFMVVVVPFTLSNINNMLIRNGFLILFVITKIYYFYYFFKTPVWIDAYSKYQTIFS